MKKTLFAFFMCISIIFSASSPCFANNVGAAPNFGQSGYLTIMQTFLTQTKGASIDANTISVRSIRELSGMRQDIIQAYAIDVTDAYGRNAYFIVDATTSVILEFSETASPYAKFHSTNSLRYSDITTYYYAPLEYWIEAENQTYIDVLSGKSVSRSAFVSAVSSPTLTSSAGQEAFESTTYSSAKAQAKAEFSAMSGTRDAVPDGYITGVPAYVQSGQYLCINTSILNVIAYWDNTSLPNLITGTIDQAREEIQSCLTAAGGAGQQSSVPGAVASYATNHGYYSSVVPMSSPRYFDLQFEINYNNPCLVGIPASSGLYTTAHMTTGVGYTTSAGSQYAIVHDNHSTSDVYILFSNVDYIGGIQLWS